MQHNSKRSKTRSKGVVTPIAVIGGVAILLSIGIAAFMRVPMIALSISSQSEKSSARCYLPSQRFELSWIHSVERTPWYEQYERQGNQLILRATHFKQYGAGTPYDGALLPPEKWGERGEPLLHYRLNRPMEIIHWIISPNVASTLTVEEKQWAIAEEFPPYSEVVISIERPQRWQYYLLEESCL